jgi:hypothetical protein
MSHKYKSPMGIPRFSYFKPNDLVSSGSTDMAITASVRNALVYSCLCRYKGMWRLTSLRPVVGHIIAVL